MVRGAALNVLDILLRAPSCQPTVATIIEHLPRLQPRPYSLASVLDEDSKADFVASIVTISASDGRAYPRRGLFTGWLEDLSDDPSLDRQILAFSRSSKTFRHPKDLDKAVIMIGPGTGVAPFRGFLQERSRMLQEKASTSPAQSWLFFGCRHQDADYIFK